ncbi:GNAT family N-acetyltransferase [Paenibacillus selenitireducens]|uniref:GNAT family N-acetyltransferase n=1 Tax=Paenibacillus selenitireducens TaxID=1324314 RepID=A0A1T2XN37_9BACL|nr:GNAT family N-acetyltransferase [Paenibacillus selenitireducens]OPA81277.1 GNAT family N-acetyltransferase [Paenibacillus selenitireducens]
MEKQTVLKKAELEQVEQVAKLFDQYRVFYGQASDLAGARQFILERLENKESVIFIAFDGSEEQSAVGFVQLYPSFSSVSMKRVWILNDLFVVSEARGQGTGRQLMSAARDFAKSNGAKGLSLTTAHDNLTAQSLYESLGYIRDEHFLTYELYF